MACKLLPWLMPLFHNNSCKKGTASICINRSSPVKNKSVVVVSCCQTGHDDQTAHFLASALPRLVLTPSGGAHKGLGVLLGRDGDRKYRLNAAPLHKGRCGPINFGYKDSFLKPISLMTWVYLCRPMIRLRTRSPPPFFGSHPEDGGLESQASLEVVRNCQHLQQRWQVLVIEWFE